MCESDYAHYLCFQLKHMDGATAKKSIFASHRQFQLKTTVVRYQSSLHIPSEDLNFKA